MSRIPKFKCWVVAAKKMLVLESTREAHNHYLQTGYGGWWLYSSATGALVASSEAGDILLESTDQPDKNEKDIYEGDILMDQYEDREYNSDTDEWGPVTRKIYYPVVFQDGCFGWIGEITGDFFDFHLDPIPEAEIVGNVYENPDLLNSKPID